MSQRKNKRQQLDNSIANNQFYTCDVGDSSITVRDSSTGEITIKTKQQFIDLEGIKSHYPLIIEGAHLRARNNLSLSHAFEFEELQVLNANAQANGNQVWRFNQDQSHSVRSYVRQFYPEVETAAEDQVNLLTTTESGHEAVKNYQASDAFDTAAIACYLTKEPELAASLLALWAPMTTGEHEKRIASVKALRQRLNQDVLIQKRQGYEVENGARAFALSILPQLVEQLTETQRAHLELKVMQRGPRKGEVDVNWSRFFPLLSTLITSDGQPRLRQDVQLLPHWKYVKRYLLGINASHRKAGVTAASIKHDCRPTLSTFRMPPVFDEALGRMKQPKASYHSKVPLELRPDFRSARAAVDRDLRDIWRTMRTLVVQQFELV